MSAANLPEKLPEPELVPQPHGGAIYAGGVPGHDGSKAGRPSLSYLAYCAQDFEAARERMLAVLADPDSKPTEIIAIWDRLMRTVVGKRKHLEADAELMNSLLAVVVRHMPELEEQIKGEWLVVLRERTAR